MEQYLLLEQARFGDRPQVKLRVDHEVLSVRIPSCASSRWWRTPCAMAWRSATPRDHQHHGGGTPARTAGSASRTTGGQ